MTEQEWLECVEPRRMPAGGPGRVERICKAVASLEDEVGLHISARRWRLFAVACVRSISYIFEDERTHRLLDAIERLAEGLMTQEDYIRLDGQANTPSNPDARVAEEDSPLYCAQQAICCAFNGADFWEAYQTAGWALNASTQPDEEEETQVLLLRDMIGNPFRPVIINPAWRTSTVVALANAAYDNRILPAGTLDPDRLTILADALEEAGCQDGDILVHLRIPGVHVRGCWPVDLLIGKE